MDNFKIGDLVSVSVVFRGAEDVKAGRIVALAEHDCCVSLSSISWDTTVTWQPYERVWDAMNNLWKPMLAAKPDPDEVDSAISKLRFPLLASPKLDGIRAVVQNGRLYSRSLKPIPNKAMQMLWGRKEFNGLDGEITVGTPTAEDCFNRTTSVVMARDKPADGAVFYAFDLFSAKPFRQRQEELNELVRRYGLAVGIKVVEQVPMESERRNLRPYEAKMLKLGYEGVMLRDPAGAYKQGRSTLKEGGLVAVKRFVDAEAVVLDTYEQMENTNEKKANELGRSKRSSHKAGKVGKSTFGGFVVKWPVEASMGLAHVFNIGTGVGLTELRREELWKKRKSLPGKIVKFRYQKIGAMKAPRFPVFLGFRGAEDLS